MTYIPTYDYSFPKCAKMNTELKLWQDLAREAYKTTPDKDNFIRVFSLLLEKHDYKLSCPDTVLRIYYRKNHKKLPEMNRSDKYYKQQEVKQNETRF